MKCRNLQKNWKNSKERSSILIHCHNKIGYILKLSFVFVISLIISNSIANAGNYIPLQENENTTDMPISEVCAEFVGLVSETLNTQPDVKEQISGAFYKIERSDIKDFNNNNTIPWHTYKDNNNNEIYNGEYYYKLDGYKVDKKITTSTAYFLKVQVSCATNDCYLYCYYSHTNPLKVETATSTDTTSSVAIYSDDIYREAESNGLATAICKAIDIATQLMVPLFAIMFSVFGLRAFQGKIELSVFFTFAIGIAAFKGAGSILEFFLPDMGLQYGCNCAVVRYVRNSDGIVNKMATGLNEDCSDVGS